MRAAPTGPEICFGFVRIELHQKVPRLPPGACCSAARKHASIVGQGDAMKKVLLCALLFPLVAEAEDVPYPKGYRQWTHVKTMQLKPGHPLYEAFGGIHHIYANKPGLQGYRTGKFPSGAVLVFDLLDAREEGAAVSEGPRKVLGVMHKDAAKYKQTGGWGFEAFKGDSRTERVVAGNAKTACYECHTSQRDHDYVFSRLKK
jgi:hypothetical protein